MAPLLSITVFSILLHSLSPIIVVAVDLSSWCKLTPHPKECQAYLSHGRNPLTPINGAPAFLRLSMETALTTTANLTKTAASLGPECKDPREQAALEDCLEVFEMAMEHLSKTLTRQCTQEDSQTWLSSALTYFQTCSAGFSDLGITNSHVERLISNADVSYLISNTLAINKIGGSGGQTPSYRDGFPSWVSPGDRKLLQSSTITPNVVVAQDGSGDYTTVTAAVNAAAKRSGDGRFVIQVKSGTYNENVQIGKSVKNIMLLGDGIGKTIITGSKSVAGGSTTFRSATVAAVGDNFIARGITFRNTAGASKHQAVALRSGSDLSVFYLCSIEGYQDTLYVYSNRQFYRQCDIYGTVDFIFGNAAVVIQDCNIYPRYPPGGKNTITAQGRTDPNQNTGISIQNCKVTAASDLAGKTSGVQTYLGRPWQEYSRTVFLTTYLDSLIAPAGWLEWSGNFALNTLYYGEYENTGPGSSTANRVNWKGYHVITSAAEASKFTVANFIAGGSWLPATNVPYDSGL
ncbi:hypothetical protein Nepgr_002440 [Nepenthes gracilis]|uniref:Pectinesterase n=1 Tax=Nepenthes gracilis TaxID=150966 RepID=A0AAD3P6U0_NEPGR|nr:hypothetical protein Nepgr_002440 [Nepenthes gracilis]